MNIQLKYIAVPDHLIERTNKELIKLGNRVIDVDVHRDNTIAGGGYSIIKYQADPATRHTVLNENK